MKEKEEVVNISFFKKVWYSITKFEQYPVMATEGVLRAIKYLTILTAIFTIFTMIGSLLQMNKVVNNLAQYIEQNIPDFSITEGKVTMDLEQPIIIEKVKYTGIDKVIINPLAETDEQQEQSEEAETVSGITIFFFKDKIVLIAKIDEGQVNKQIYTYNEFVKNYTGKNIQTFNKAELIRYLTGQEMMQFYIRYGASMYIYLLLANIIYTLAISLEIAIFGWITATLARIRMKFSAIYSMATYSLTLSIILNICYAIVNYFINFKIKYFETAYVVIAYIYIAATIFILKDDLIKRMQEVEKVRQEQKKVREEIKEQEKPKEDDKEEKKKEKEKGKDKEDGEEPQGSEA